MHDRSQMAAPLFTIFCSKNTLLFHTTKQCFDEQRALVMLWCAGSINGASNGRVALREGT